MCVSRSEEPLTRVESLQVVVGGDGTHHEVVTGLARRRGSLQSCPPVAFVGGGSNNCLLASMDMLDVRAACNRLLLGRVRRIDVPVCSKGNADGLQVCVIVSVRIYMCVCVCVE